MSPTDSQLAAFKAIRQEAQSLMRTRLTSDVRDGLERILAVTRVQINAGNAARQAEMAQNGDLPPPPTGMQERLSQTPTEKRSRILWIVVLTLWLVVGYLGTQNYKKILQLPSETAQASEVAPAQQAPETEQTQDTQQTPSK